MDRLPEYRLDKKLLKENDRLKWMFTGENSDYVAPEFLVLTQSELYAIKQATAECHKMLLHACEYAITNKMWAEVGLPKNAIDAVTHSWNTRHPYLFGRIDFAGGVDNIPLKLLEFNADVATLMPEAIDAQNMIFKAYAPQGATQCNDVIAGVSQTLRQIGVGSLLGSSFGYPEDVENTYCVMKAASQAGIPVLYTHLENVIFDPEEGIMVESGERYTVYPYWYKVIPWEIIALDEPELMDLLTDLTISNKVKVLNPAYSMVMQSKGLLPIVNRLYPNHTLLLESAYDFSPFRSKKYIKKVIYGRLGENIQIYDQGGMVTYMTKGDFGSQPAICQEIAEFFRDEDNCHYQISAFTNGECLGLGVRRQDKPIIDSDAEFVPHYIS